MTRLRLDSLSKSALPAALCAILTLAQPAIAQETGSGSSQSETAQSEDVQETFNAMPDTPGGGNFARTDQRGSGNIAFTSQMERRNIAVTRQIGDDNTATTTQSGTRNVAITVQVGDGFDSVIEQTGNNQTETVIQVDGRGMNSRSGTGSVGNGLMSSTIRYEIR